MLISTYTEHKMIDAANLLLAKYPETHNDYEVGWNDALQTAYDVETESEEGKNESEKSKGRHGTADKTD